MTNTKTNTTTTNNSKNITKQDYLQFMRNTVNTLDTMNSRSFSPMLLELINSRANDIKALNNEYFATAEMNAVRTIEDTDETIQEINNCIKNITTSESDKQALLIKLSEIEHTKAQAQEDRATATDKHNTSIRFSDLADCVQEYATAYLYEEPTQTERNKVFTNFSKQVEEHTQKHNPYMFSNASMSALAFFEVDTELHEDWARYYHAKSRVTSYIRSNKAPTAIDGTHTKTKAATAEEVKQWINAGHQIGDNYYYQLDNQTRISLIEKNGIYKFRKQHKTIKNHTSIEKYTDENGEYFIDGYIKNYDVYVDNFGALDRITKLFNIAKLTDRELLFLKAFNSKTALNVEITAHSNYLEKCYKRAEELTNEHNKKYYVDREQAEIRASKKAYTMRVDYAIRRATGLTIANSKNHFINRLLNKLRKSADIIGVNKVLYYPCNEWKTNDFKNIKKSDHEEKQDFKYFNHLMISNRGTAQIIEHYTMSMNNFITVIDEEYTALKNDNKTYYKTVYKYTPIETNIINWLSETQAEGVRADWKMQLIQELAKSEIDNSTPEKQHTAETNHARYILKQATNNSPFIHLATAEELQTACKQLEKHRAKAKAKAEQEQRRAEQRRRKAQQNRLTEYKQTAVYNFMYSKLMNNAELKEFKKLNLKQQYNKMCMINFVNGFIACQHLNGSELEEFKKLNLKEQYRTAKANY